MIRSFKNRRLKKLYEQGDGRKLPSEMVPRIKEILALLDVATTVQDMDIPQFRLHPLKGRYEGFWAATVRANWRIVFRFVDEPEDLDFIDYH